MSRSKTKPKEKRGNNLGCLFKRGKGGTWYIRTSERQPDGKRKRVTISTHTSNYDMAREQLEDFIGETALDRGREKHLQKTLEAAGNLELKIKEQERARKAAEEQAAIEAAKQAQAALDREALTFSSAFLYYCDSGRRPDSGKRTLADYETYFENFHAFMKERYPKVTRIRDVTSEHAEAFLKRLSETHSHGTHNKHLIFLRSMWKVLKWVPEAQLSINPWEGIRTLGLTNDVVNHKELTIEQLASVGKALREANTNPPLTFEGADIRDEITMLFVLGLFTGLRLGDCCTMSWDRIDLVRGIIDTKPRKTQRKCNRQVVIPIHRALAAMLLKIKGKHISGYVLPTIANMYLHHDTSLITSRVQAIFKAAGIKTTEPAPGCGAKHRTLVGFHSLRHTFASLMLNAGVTQAITERLMGHAGDSLTTKVYFHEHEQALKAAIGTIPTIPELTGDAPATVLELPDAPADDNSKQMVVTITNPPLSDILASLGNLTADELCKVIGTASNRLALLR